MIGSPSMQDVLSQTLKPAKREPAKEQSHTHKDGCTDHHSDVTGWTCRAERNLVQTWGVQYVQPQLGQVKCRGEEFDRLSGFGQRVEQAPKMHHGQISEVYESWCTLARGSSADKESNRTKRQRSQNFDQCNQQKLSGGDTEMADRQSCGDQRTHYDGCKLHGHQHFCKQVSRRRHEERTLQGKQPLFAFRRDKQAESDHA